MVRRFRALLVGITTVCSLLSGGCQLTYFTISIPDFISKDVSGVWLWRQSPTTGLFVRDAQFVFQAVQDGPEGELLDYIATSSDGATSVPLSTGIVHDGEDTDRITLSLIFARTSEPGVFRASTYNAAGESPLTDEMVSL
jgi:hypothetical protein